MTRLAPRRWALRYLLLAWCGYWLALVLVVLGPPALLTWRLTHDPGRHGSVSAGLTNDVLALTVSENGATRWAGRTSLLVLALWFAVPPLLLFVAWWHARPARDAHASPDALRQGAGPLLDDGRVPGAAEGFSRAAQNPAPPRSRG